MVALQNKQDYFLLVHSLVAGSFLKLSEQTVSALKIHFFFFFTNKTFEKKKVGFSRLQFANICVNLCICKCNIL